MSKTGGSLNLPQCQRLSCECLASFWPLAGKTLRTLLVAGLILPLFHPHPGSLAVDLAGEETRVAEVTGLLEFLEDGGPTIEWACKVDPVRLILGASASARLIAFFDSPDLKGKAFSLHVRGPPVRCRIAG